VYTPPTNGFGRLGQVFGNATTAGATLDQFRPDLALPTGTLLSVPNYLAQNFQAGLLQVSNSYDTNNMVGINWATTWVNGTAVRLVGSINITSNVSSAPTPILLTWGNGRAVAFAGGRKVYDNAFTINWVNGTARLWLNRGAGGGSTYTHGQSQFMAAVSTNYTGDEDAALLTLNPWALFEPANSPIFYSLPSPAFGVTLSNATVFNITPVSANPRVTITY
jgi:hypothetical protein